MLVILGGLPGTGKTTLARALARRFAAVRLRIDTIEQAIRIARPGTRSRRSGQGAGGLVGEID